jgi:hypothetical protein
MSISSSMALFQRFPSYESTASLTVLGSSSVIDKAKFERKSDGVYLSVAFFLEPISSILEYEDLLLLIHVLL